MSTTKLLRRVDPARLGSLAVTAALLGLFAGILAATFGTIAGEPAIDEAIAIEEANAAAEPSGADHGDDEDEATVDRSDQKGVGLFSAYALTGAAFGGLLALTTLGLRRGRPDLFRRVLLGGSILAGAVTVAPWLKYPPNPPAVGDPGTLGERQGWYVTTICLAALVGLAATVLARRLRELQWPEHARIPTLVAVVAVPMLLAFAFMPGAIDDIDVSATLLWRFRLASLGSNLTLWTVLTLSFAWVTTEAARQRAGQGPPVVEVGAGAGS